MEDKLDLINVEGQDTFIFHGTLSYEPKCCTNCGCIKEGNNIVKNGFTDPLKVALLKISEFPTYLRLKNNALNVENVILSFVLKHHLYKNTAVYLKILYFIL